MIFFAWLYRQRQDLCHLHSPVNSGLLKDVDKAFDYLEKALEYHYDEWDNILLKDEPGFDILREQTARWEALMKQYSITD